MIKELITKTQIVKELDLESKDFESLMNSNILHYYEFKGDIGFDKTEVNKLLNTNNNKINPIIKYGNNLFGILSKTIPLFYAIAKLFEMTIKGILGV